VAPLLTETSRILLSRAVCTQTDVLAFPRFYYLAAFDHILGVRVKSRARFPRFPLRFLLFVFALANPSLYLYLSLARSLARLLSISALLATRSRDYSPPAIIMAHF